MRDLRHVITLWFEIQWRSTWCAPRFVPLRPPSVWCGYTQVVRQTMNEVKIDMKLISENMKRHEVVKGELKSGESR